MLAITFICSCQVQIGEPDENEIHDFVDQWHLAAAEADSAAYFGAMAPDGVFIGTDLSEVWTRQEFAEWAKPFFDAGKAWQFNGEDRNVYFSKDGILAWFDETVKSTAGNWRGSGVLEKSETGWKIKHYVLSMTVPNELMGKFAKEIKVFEEEKN